MTGSGAADSLGPRQAVILAGGRGTRMRPLTTTRPKPMVEFHGKPFLEYLIEMLREQGFERALLLLGYLPDVIQDHFGDGGRWGLEIDYSISGPDDLTVSRIQLARERIEQTFLLMYCDNYWPMQMDRMWRRYQATRAPAMVTVYSNNDGYRPGKDSVLVDRDGFVTVFDRKRVTPGLRGVEISYAILNKSVLELLPEQDELVEQALYPQLAERRQLSAYLTDHRYYSVGSLERLPVTERFLARRPAVILDRDGVLNRRPPRAEYVRRPDEFEWLPGARRALALLKEAGYTVIVVSNQAGIARGAMTEGDLDAIHARMRAEAAEAGGGVDAIYHCPHGWDDGCDCRKPAPGMLFQAQRDFELDLTRTPFIGDDERDRQAADAAGSPSVLVSERLTLLNAVRTLVAERPQAVAP
jgi:histidinol-phosphate phosphatase family protein